MSGAAEGKVFGLAGTLTFCGSLARPQVTQCCWSPVHWKRDDLMRPAFPAPSWCSTEAGPSRSYREPGSGELGKTWRPLFASGFIMAHMQTVGLKGSWAKPHVRGSPKIHLSSANLSMAQIHLNINLASTYPTLGMVLYPTPQILQWHNTH